jgi:hypothetical protein
MTNRHTYNRQVHKHPKYHRQFIKVVISYCLTFDLSKPQLFIDTDLNECKRKFSTNTYVFPVSLDCPFLISPSVFSNVYVGDLVIRL